MASLRSFRFSPGSGLSTSVVVGEGALARLSRDLRRITPGRWFVVSSQPVFFLHGERLLRESAPADLDPSPVLVPDGESAKKWSVLGRVIEELVARGLRRDGGVVALGGGTVGDVGGLAASLVHRGLRVVRMPTTVAGQNDVGVGVKNGIDLYGCKNFLGTFAPPFAVINDFDFLDLLPDRDWIAGIAEAFKVAMIKDRRFFSFLCRNACRLRNRDHGAMEHLVRQCARLHLDHIRDGGDPFETGSARPLDFGHWSAHELEVLSHYQLRHGEAVAIGIALDSYYALKTHLISRQAFNALITGLQRCGLPVSHPVLSKRCKNGTLAILGGLTRFQEHLGGPLTITLPSPLGQQTNIHSMDPAILEQGIAYLTTLPAAS